MQLTERLQERNAVLEEKHERLDKKVEHLSVLVEKLSAGDNPHQHSAQLSGKEPFASCSGRLSQTSRGSSGHFSSPRMGSPVTTNLENKQLAEFDTRLSSAER